LAKKVRKFDSKKAGKRRLRERGRPKRDAQATGKGKWDLAHEGEEKERHAAKSRWDKGSSSLGEEDY